MNQININFTFRTVSEILNKIYFIKDYSILGIILLIISMIILVGLILYILPSIGINIELIKKNKEKLRKKRMLKQILIQKEIEDEIEQEIKEEDELR